MSLTDREKAKQLYINNKGTIPLVDIAEQVGRPPGTVRGWKSKDDWDGALAGTFQDETERYENTERKSKKEVKREVKIIKEVASNDNLNDKQQLFCIYYLKYFNATKSYQKAYKCSYNTARTEGSRFLSNPNIKAELDRLKQEQMNELMLDSRDIMQKYIDIAFSDITDYVEFGTEEVVEMINGTPIIDDETGELKTYTKNYVKFKDDEMVDGTIISEIGMGRDGAKIKMQDKMKALEWLANNIVRFKGELDVELLETKIERERLNTELVQLELDKSTGAVVDDKAIKEFIEATSPSSEKIAAIFGDVDEE